MARDLDWREYVNALVYCFGCGRFGKPSPKGIPDGWKVLYNPHSEGKPGLHVCGAGCAAKVSAALREGPVLEPLEMSVAPPMPQEMRQAALEGSVAHRVKERVSSVLDDPEAVEAVTGAVTEALLEKPYEVKVPLRALPGFDDRSRREVDALADWHRAMHGDDDFGTEEENEPPHGEEARQWFEERGLEMAEEDPDVPWGSDEKPKRPHLRLVPMGDPEAEQRLADDMAMVEEMHRPQGLPAEMLDDGRVKGHTVCPSGDEHDGED